MLVECSKILFFLWMPDGSWTCNCVAKRCQFMYAWRELDIDSPSAGGCWFAGYASTAHIRVLPTSSVIKWRACKLEIRCCTRNRTIRLFRSNFNYLTILTGYRIYF
jgi:hypothetical protein